MDNFQQACRISCSNWIDSILTNCADVSFDEIKHSRSFDRKMAKLLDKMRNDKYHRFTRKTVRFLIAAALIASLAVTAFAIEGSRNFIIERFKTHSVFSMSGESEYNSIGSLELGYIPKGYSLTKESVSENRIIMVYKSDSREFSIIKHTANHDINIDSEDAIEWKDTVNGVEYFGYAQENSYNTYLWNDGKFVYCITGNIDKNEMKKIAINVKC